ncbi:MAG TPA: inositol monophosphatase [Patescibacteria group bacterium]|nr:inositol monophosphatase [Patescibacteria group bacterium]
MSDELKIAIEAAKAGAHKALQYFNENIKFEHKKDNTVVSVADTDTEKAIKKEIISKYPGAKFIGEETGGDFDQKEFWAIDPIDGSRSYSRGIPNWCVLVSLCRDNEVELGVVYYPHSDTLFYAQKGMGAFENGKPIHVSQVSKLKDSYVGFGSMRHFKNKQVIIDLVEAAESCRAWEPTFGHCMVASGRVDLCVEEYGKIWDIAPFKVIVEEAGGKVTRHDGSPWTFKGQGSLISNGLLHDQALAIINKRK